MTARQSPDVIVVGGGVIGCSIAYHLAREGVTVAVLDRGEFGGEASSAAAGMLAPLSEMESAGPLQDLGLASLRLFPELAATLQREAGVDIEYLASGILRVALNEDEEAHLRGLAADAGPGLEVCARVTSDKPVIAERPMYFNYQGYSQLNWNGGNDVMGATEPGDAEPLGVK